MPTRRTILLTATVCTFVMAAAMDAAPATAGDAAATAFVTKIYDAYKSKNSRGYSIGSEADIRRTFEPTLATEIIKDQKAAAKRHDVSAIDSDPFVDGQEWDISALTIAVSNSTPGKAVATVNFKNFGKPTQIVVNLVKTKSDWQIADITWQRDGSPETLRGLLRH
jgi:hypothetical protein